MSILIRIGEWLVKTHHDRLIKRLVVSAKAQRRYVMWLQETETDGMSDYEIRMHHEEIERAISVVFHLEGLIKDLRISDNFSMYI